MSAAMATTRSRYAFRRCFVGFPSLVRGYDIGTFDIDDCEFSPVALAP